MKISKSLASPSNFYSMKDHGVTITVTDQLLSELANLWSEGVGPTIQTILQEEILSVTMNDKPSTAAVK